MINVSKYQEKVKNKYPNEDLTVIKYLGAKAETQIKCNTCGKIYSYTMGGNAIKKSKTYLCQDCGPLDKKRQSFIANLQRLYPEDNIEIIEFTTNKNPCTLKCKKCGDIVHFSQGANAFDRNKFYCKKCHPYKHDMFVAHLERFKDFIQDSNKWELVTDLNSLNHTHDLVYCKCKVCGSVTGKTMSDYERGRGCIDCSGRKLKTTEQFRQELDDDYELLTEYEGANKKVYLKHSCGFIYPVTPHNYLTGKRCPQCMRKHSKGEKRIQKFLEDNNINYIQEYQEKIQGHLLRYDFYLPDNNLYIEYHGIQHYEPVEYFGGIKRFIKQQEYDKLKEKDNIIYINYKQFDKIEIILSDKILSSTTISKESTS